MAYVGKHFVGIYQQMPRLFHVKLLTRCLFNDRESHIVTKGLSRTRLTLGFNHSTERSIEMKKRLNEQLSVRSALLIVVPAMLLILMSATIAKACGPWQTTVGCDSNCTVQIVNDCSEGFNCVARTCDKLCVRPTCNPPRCISHICATCVPLYLGGCRGLPECCSGTNGCN